MSDFKAKMHHIRFWLGLVPDPTGELTVPEAGFEGPTSKGGMGVEEREG